MSRFLSTVLICSLIVPAFSYNKKAVEQELQFLSKDAREYLTEVMIWVAVIAIVIFAIVLCICDMGIGMFYNRCSSTEIKSTFVDVETASTSTATSSTASTAITTSCDGEDYYTYENCDGPSRSVVV